MDVSCASLNNEISNIFLFHFASYDTKSYSPAVLTVNFTPSALQSRTVSGFVVFLSLASSHHLLFQFQMIYLSVLYIFSLLISHSLSLQLIFCCIMTHASHHDSPAVRFLQYFPQLWQTPSSWTSNQSIIVQRTELLHVTTSQQFTS